jgi:hypothetical protein
VGRKCGWHQQQGYAISFDPFPECIDWVQRNLPPRQQILAVRVPRWRAVKHRALPRRMGFRVDQMNLFVVVTSCKIHER